MCLCWCVCVAVADGRTPPSAWKCQYKVESFVCSLVPTCLSCHGVGELSKTFVTFCPFRALFEARFYYLYIFLRFSPISSFLCPIQLEDHCIFACINPTQMWLPDSIHFLILKTKLRHKIRKYIILKRNFGCTEAVITFTGTFIIA